MTAKKSQPATPEGITAEDGARAGTVWADLAAPFDAKWIEKLPKQLRRDDQRKGRCSADSDEGRLVSADGHFCGGYHARSVHLDYVGHAGITMRLNKVLDPSGWRLEPVARTPEGLPIIPNGGPFWARLVITVDGAEVAHEDVAANYNSIQEAWGDALRRTAMRFGVGTYLWAKSEHAAELAQHKDPDPLEQEQAAGKILAGALKSSAAITVDQFDGILADPVAVPPALLDVVVTTQGGRVKLADALAEVRAAIVKHHEAIVEKAAQEAAKPPSAPETQQQAPEAPTMPAETQQQPPAPEPQAPAGESPQAAAYDVARESLATADADVLLGYYRASEDLLAVDVIGVVGDDDLAALDAPRDLTALPLGQLLIAVGKYVRKHGSAVRDLGEPMPSAPASGQDPWADDAAAGWPERGRD